MPEVQVVLRHLAPGQVQHELDVVVLDAVVRGGGVVLLQAVHLLVEDGAYLLGPFLLVGPGAELGEILLLIHAQLFLDGTELVVQVVFALLLVDVALDLLVDLLLDLEELHLGVQDLQQLQSPLLQAVNLQQTHAVVEVLHLDGRRDEVHQEGEIVDGLEGAHGLLRREGGSVHDLGGALLEGVGQDGDLLVIGARGDVFQILYARDDIGFIAQYGIHGDPLEPLQDGGQGAVRHFQGLEHLAHGSAPEQVLRLGFLHRHVRLGNGAQDTVLRLHVPDDPDGFLPADGHGEHRPREDHGIAEGQDREGVLELGLVEFQEGGIPDDRHDIHFYARMRAHLIEIFHSAVKNLGYDNLSYPGGSTFRRHILSISVPRTQISEN